MKIIAGLGNPGAKYANTRHNVGFVCADALAAAAGASLSKRAHDALTGEGRLDGERVVIVKPQTYMNLSGQSVASALRWFRVDITDLIVVHDDLDLPVGKIRIRKGGGSGGQKGVASIIAEAGSGDFIRVRVGVGRPPTGWDAAGHVLSPFGKDELTVMADTIARAVEAVRVIVREGPDKAMNLFNGA